MIKTPMELLCIERGRFKAAIPSSTQCLVGPPDPFRFAQGVPLLSMEQLADLASGWEETAPPYIEAMETGFAGIKEDLRRLGDMLGAGHPETGTWIIALLRGQDSILDDAASRLGVERRGFKLVLGQLLKPCLEKRVQAFNHLVEELRWTRGYCPMCGALPELGLLEETSGERMLLCSLCGHRWSFPEAECPYCGCQDEQKKEWFHIQGQEDQWVELCHECNRYLVSVDARRLLDFSVLENASVGIVHLDVLAQRRGFLPVAVCPWNLVIREDIILDTTTMETKESYGNPPIH